MMWGFIAFAVGAVLLVIQSVLVVNEVWANAFLLLLTLLVTVGGLVVGVVGFFRRFFAAVERR